MNVPSFPRNHFKRRPTRMSQNLRNCLTEHERQQTSSTAQLQHRRLLSQTFLMNTIGHMHMRNSTGTITVSLNGPSSWPRSPIFSHWTAADAQDPQITSEAVFTCKMLNTTEQYVSPITEEWPSHFAYNEVEQWIKDQHHAFGNFLHNINRGSQRFKLLQRVDGVYDFREDC